MFPTHAKILVVDDIASLRELHIQLLRELGFMNIVSAENGAIALDLLRNSKGTEQVDLILCDFQMPISSGQDLLRECKEDSRLSSIPFLMISSVNELNLVMELIEQGLSDFLLKPINAKVLQKKLVRVYEHHFKEMKRR